MKKKVVITGAAGFVGLNIISLIDTKKYEVVAIDKNQNGLDVIKEINPLVKLINADLKEMKERWLQGLNKASCLIQLQAQISSSDREEYISNNVQSVKNVLKACKKYKINNLIHISTSGVISAARDNYSITKTLGEQMVRESKIPHTILRPTMIYGRYEIKHLGYLSRILDSAPILPFPGNGKYIRQPLFVGDLCRIIIKLIETKPKKKIYNLIGKEQIYFIDMIKMITRMKKQRRFLLILPIPIFFLLLKLYSLITKKRPYQESQLTALITPEIFPFKNLEKKFDIKYTEFKDGIKEYINPQHQKYVQGARL